MVKYLVLLFAVYTVFLEESLLSVADSDYKLCCKCHTWQSDQYRSGKCESFTCGSFRCRNDASCRLQSGECCVSVADSFKGCRQCEYDSNCRNGKKCCHGLSASQTRCRENCLGSYCRRTSLCGGSEECCRNNLCVNCSLPGCKSNDECQWAEYCCNKKDAQGDSFCHSSCVGSRCEADTDCANHECCYEEKCVKCTSLRCSSDSDCSSGYCCNQGYTHDKSRCMTAGCVGQTCARTSGCGGEDECCRDKVCAYCSESRCKHDSECPVGEHCCKRDGQAICSRSCVGQFCNTTEDCGARGECCIANKCTTQGCYCTSNFDCKIGEYCCRKDHACSSSCIGKSCFVSDSDCGAPGEECTYPDNDCYFNRYEKKCPELPEYKCFNKSGCYSHNDCSVFGSHYYCCRTDASEKGSCHSNCLKKFCNENSDCGGSSECCNSDNQCYKCPNNVRSWVIGISVGIPLLIITAVVVVIRYIRSKRKQEREESQPTQTGAIEMEVEQNNHYENFYSQRLPESNAGAAFIDDVQSAQPTQAWTGILSFPQQMPVWPSQNLKLNNLSDGKSNKSLAGNGSDDNETVVPSAPPLPYPVTPPPHPPPSYQNLFGNR